MYRYFLNIKYNFIKDRDSTKLFILESLIDVEKIRYIHVVIYKFVFFIN